MDLNQFTDSIPKRLVVHWTESKYETTLQFFNRYYELYPGSTFPPNYQTFKGFLVWVSKLTKGRIKSRTLRLLPYISNLESFLRYFLAVWGRAERPDIANTVAKDIKFVRTLSKLS